MLKSSCSFTCGVGYRWEQTGDWPAPADVGNPLWTFGGITKYYYFGTQRVAMQNASGLIYLHSDQLGSTSVAIDAYGVQLSTQVYYPFGGVRATTGASPTDYGFTGQKLM